MKQLLKRLLIFFGLVSILLPLLMIYLWSTYASEQEQEYSTIVASRKPCEPYGFTTIKSGDSLAFSWKTREKCTGFLLLAENYASFAYLPYQVMPDIPNEKSTEHVVRLLAKDQIKYSYAIVVSDGEWFGINENPFVYAK
jgi:hypothetical protein